MSQFEVQTLGGRCVLLILASVSGSAELVTSALAVHRYNATAQPLTELPEASEACI
jgi:hypothetical protein